MDIASDSIERVTRSSGNVIYVTSYRPWIRARAAGGPTRLWHHAWRRRTTFNGLTRMRRQGIRGYGETGDGAPEAAAIKGWSDMVGAVGAVMGPLTEGDPRRVGPYTTLGRLGAGALGPLYAGRADDGRVAGSGPCDQSCWPSRRSGPGSRPTSRRPRTVPRPFAVRVLDAVLAAETPWVAWRSSRVCRWPGRSPSTARCPSPRC